MTAYELGVLAAQYASTTSHLKQAHARGFTGTFEKKAVEWDDEEGNMYHSSPLFYTNLDLYNQRKNIFKSVISDKKRRKMLRDPAQPMTVDEWRAYVKALLTAAQTTGNTYGWEDPEGNLLKMSPGMARRNFDALVQRIANDDDLVSLSPVSPRLKKTAQVLGRLAVQYSNVP